MVFTIISTGTAVADRTVDSASPIVGATVISLVLNLAFAALLVVLLLHPESRRYQRIWFR